MGTQMIYKFMATILPIKYPSSPNVSLILFTSLTIWFRAIWLGFSTFDPIVINGETISNIQTTRTCFFKFVNLDLSIRCSLSNFRTPCAMVRTSLDYCNGLLGGKPCEVSHQSVIWRVRKGPVPHWLDISAKKCVQDLRACSPMPCLRGSAPPYLIPHANERHPWTHIRTSQIGCGGHVKISRPRSQTLTIGSWEFCYLFPFCMELHPGRSSWSRI